MTETIPWPDGSKAPDILAFLDRCTPIQSKYVFARAQFLYGGADESAGRTEESFAQAIDEVEAYDEQYNRWILTGSVEC